MASSNESMTETVGYAGDITPEQAWQMLESNPDAVLVDVRTVAEWQFVGVPDTTALGRPTQFVVWGDPNADFVAQLRARGVEQGPVIFLCRSGQRSISASIAATSAGLGPAYNVLDGFEGALDENGHRGGAGWRAVGLPWSQS